MNNSQYAASCRIVKAYRTWFHQIQQEDSSLACSVYMDDLSDLPRTASNGNINFLEVLNSELGEGFFDEPHLLKLKNSIAFAQSCSRKPTRENVILCGGWFEHVTERDIGTLNEQIIDAEKAASFSTFPHISEGGVVYAKRVAERGFEYLKSISGVLHPMHYKVQSLGPNAPFLAQVVTNDEGEIVCQISPKDQVDAFFSLVSVHEILGHVLHFSQLKANRSLQQMPHLLVLSIHTHECFFIEAIAQLMTHFLVNSAWDIEGKDHIRLADLKYLRNQALAHMLMSAIIDGNIDCSEAGKTHLYLSNSNEPNQNMIKAYENATSTLFKIKAALNYYPAFCAAKPLLNLDEQSFGNQLNSLLGKYFTPESFRTYVAESVR